MGSNQRLLEHGSWPEDRRIADISARRPSAAGSCCFENPGQAVQVTVDPDGFADDSVFVPGTWCPDPQFCIECGGGLVGYGISLAPLHEPPAIAASPLRRAPRYLFVVAHGQPELQESQLGHVRDQSAVWPAPNPT